ncbi:uncharacterized protein JCM6883_004837, partial [Sporobolomyces salmoneus]|uniref:uncharacterized protein n=1 Tax=Sporobolomyces salmoneus TaxID=183962 RepID=UPI00317E9D79
MHGTPASHRLPDELIVEIIKAMDDIPFDLAQVCLVSRRFLSTARRQLHRHVEIGALDVYPDTMESPVELSLATSLLLKTFLENPDLAQNIRSIRFRQCWDELPGEFNIDITARELVTKFVSIASEVKTLRFAEEWFVSGPEMLDASSGWKDLEGLTFDLMHVETPAKIAQTFPRLKHLQAFNAELNSLPIPTFSSLETLDI